jgi:hypothetical protein
MDTIDKIINREIPNSKKSLIKNNGIKNNTTIIIFKNALLKNALILKFIIIFNKIQNTTNIKIDVPE